MARTAERERTHSSWDLHESGRLGAEHTVLLLPGALATWPFYDDLVRQPKLSDESIRFVAATLPGFGGTPPPQDQSVENYARLAAGLAADFQADVVVGHSFGANVALEMAAAGAFAGPLVLLSPTFSRPDESKVPRALDKLGRVFGNLPFTLMFKGIGGMLKGEVPPARQEALAAELKRNEPASVRGHLREYLPYLDRHGSLVPRLCDSGVEAWVVFGDRKDIGLADEERRGLEEWPRTRLITIAGTGHFALNQEPGAVAEVVLEAVSTV